MRSSREFQSLRWFGVWIGVSMSRCEFRMHGREFVTREGHAQVPVTHLKSPAVQVMTRQRKDEHHFAFRSSYVRLTL